jgi:hypothetical protein
MPIQKNGFEVPSPIKKYLMGKEIRERHCKQNRRNRHTGILLWGIKKENDKVIQIKPSSHLHSKNNKMLRMLKVIHKAYSNKWENLVQRQLMNLQILRNKKPENVISAFKSTKEILFSDSDSTQYFSNSRRNRAGISPFNRFIESISPCRIQQRLGE